MNPSFSISILISSPTFNQLRSVNAAPAGVPVVTKSPGNNEKAVDKYSIILKQLKIRSLVLALCPSFLFT